MADRPHKSVHGAIITGSMVWIAMLGLIKGGYIKSSIKWIQDKIAESAPLDG